MARRHLLEPILKPLVLHLTDVRRGLWFSSAARRFFFKWFKIIAHEHEDPELLRGVYEDGGEVVVKKSRYNDGLKCTFEGAVDVDDAVRKIQQYCARTETLYFRGCTIKQEAVQRLTNFPNLAALNFEDCSIADTSQWQLPKLPVTELAFDGGCVPKQFVAECISQMDNLRYLHIEDIANFQGDSLSALRSRTERLLPVTLQELQIINCQNLVQSNLTRLDACVAFDSLNIWNSPLTNEVFEHIARIQNLRRLALSEVSVGSGLERLADMPNLRHVTLNCTKFETLSQLEPLIKMAGKARISIKCDTLIAADQEKLRERLYEMYRERTGDFDA